MTEGINETSERMIDQSYNTADILLTSTYVYFSQLLINSDIINNAMYGTDFGPLDIHKINHSLNDNAQTNPLISSIYVFNSNTGIVFASTLDFSTLDQFYDKKIRAESFSLLS